MTFYGKKRIDKIKKLQAIGAQVTFRPTLGRHPETSSLAKQFHIPMQRERIDLNASHQPHSILMLAKIMDFRCRSRHSNGEPAKNYYRKNHKKTIIFNRQCHVPQMVLGRSPLMVSYGRMSSHHHSLGTLMYLNALISAPPLAGLSRTQYQRSYGASFQRKQHSKSPARK